MAWKKIEWPDVPAHIEPGDCCWYARNYLSGGGYAASDDNNLIFNLKTDIEHRDNKWRWRHRTRAVRQFAYELSELFPENETDDVYPIAAMPTSKPRGASGYNDRLDSVLASVANMRSDINVIDAIDRHTAIRSASKSGDDRPTVEEHIATLESTGNADEVVYLVDDVITAGSTFRACSNVLRAANPNLKVFGVFWAKTYWEDAWGDFDLSELLGL